MEVETVNDEIVVAGPSYLEDTYQPPRKSPPSEVESDLFDAYQWIRSRTERFRTAVLILERDDDDKGGGVVVMSTKGTSRDRALVLTGKAGEFLHRSTGASVPESWHIGLRIRSREIPEIEHTEIPRDTPKCRFEVIP